MKTKIIIAALVKRELSSILATASDLVVLLSFYLISVSLFAICLSHSPMLLKSIGSIVIWVCTLFSILLSMPSLFEEDAVDHTLEQLLMLAIPLSLTVTIKLLLHWLIRTLPIIVMSLLIAILFGLDADEIFRLLTSLLLGTPVVVMIGALGAALSLGAKNSGVLIAVLSMPLYVPILIFGAGVVDDSSLIQSADQALRFLVALLVLSGLSLPFVIASSLKIALD